MLRQHEKIAVASKRFHAMLRQDLLSKLHTVMEMVLNLIRRTKTGDDPKLFLQATRAFSRILRLIDKRAAQFQLDPEFIYSLMASYQWEVQEPSLLPSAFQAVSETRRTLKSNLFSPCPEPEPETKPIASALQKITPQRTRLPWSVTARTHPKSFPNVGKNTSQNQHARNMRATA